MIARAVARYIDTAVTGLTYSQAGTTGNVFVQWSPASPDRIVSVMGTGGLPNLTVQPYDDPTVQILTRSDDLTEGHDRARAIYDALAGLALLTLAEGTDDEVFVILCTAQESEPTSIGRDGNDRHEWSQNFHLQTHNPTTHRPQ